MGCVVYAVHSAAHDSEPTECHQQCPIQFVLKTTLSIQGGPKNTRTPILDIAFSVRSTAKALTQRFIEH